MFSDHQPVIVPSPEPTDRLPVIGEWRRHLRTIIPQPDQRHLTRNARPGPRNQPNPRSRVVAYLRSQPVCALIRDSRRRIPAAVLPIIEARSSSHRRPAQRSPSAQRSSQPAWSAFQCSGSDFMYPTLSRLHRGAAGRARCLMQFRRFMAGAGMWPGPRIRVMEQQRAPLRFTVMGRGLSY